MFRRARWFGFLSGFATLLPALATQALGEPVARVFFLGDCEHLDFPPVPARGVGESFQFITRRDPTEPRPWAPSTATSQELRAFLEARRAREPIAADVLVLSAGRNDSEVDAATGLPRVPQSAYEQNLREMIACARAMRLEPVWLNLAAPPNDPVAARLNEAYNAAATRVMEELRVMIFDYREFCRLLPPSAVHAGHVTPDGLRRQADYVVEAIGHWWTACAQSNPRDRRERLWSDLPPAYQYPGPERINARSRIDHISVPEIIHFPAPASPSGTAIVYFPGGGYSYLGFTYNGRELARRLQRYGITVIGLKYRTGRGAEAPLLDAQRAVQFARAHARAWGLDPHRIGVAGESAGANLALQLAVHDPQPDSASADPISRESGRPDFVAVFSSWNFGSNDCPFVFRAGTPPFFVGHAKDDRAYPLALRIIANLQQAQVPVQAEIADDGGHGAFEFGQSKGRPEWPSDLVAWLERMRLWRQPARGN